MKKYLIPLIVIVLALSFAAFVFAVPSSQNQGKIVSAQKQLLADGDMEKSGTSDWSVSVQNPTLSKISGAIVDGKRQLSMTRTGAGFGTDYIYQSILTPGKKYKVTGWMKKSNAQSGYGTLVLLGTTEVWRCTGSCITSTDWQYISGIGVADGTDIQFSVGNVTQGTISLFDDLYVTEYTPPQTNVEKQLLADGDMEKAGTSDWTDGGYTLSSKQAGAVEDGRQIIRIANTDASSRTVNSYQNILTIGKTYRVTGWARLSEGEGDPPKIMLGGTSNAVWQGVGSTTEWQRIDGIGIADNVYLRLWLGSCNAGNYVEFDDIMVTEYTPPATNKSYQLLEDGDMETSGTDDWSTVNSATLTKQPGAAEDGLQLLRIAYSDTNNPGAVQDIGAVNGVTYRVTGWARGDGTGYPRIRWSGGTVFWTGTASTDWQRFDAITVADASTVGTISMQTMITEAGYSEFDDVVVTALP